MSRWGAGGVGFLTFLTFGALKPIDLRRSSGCLPERSLPEQPAKRNRTRGSRYQTIANVGLGVAIVGSFGGWHSSRDQRERTLRRPAIDAAKRPKGLVVTDVAIGPGSLEGKGRVLNGAVRRVSCTSSRDRLRRVYERLRAVRRWRRSRRRDRAGSLPQRDSGQRSERDGHGRQR